MRTNKTIIILLLMSFFVIGIATTEQETANKGTGFTTDLGKGKPYTGLTAQEQAKLEQMQGKEMQQQSVLVKTKKTNVATDLGKNKPYTGLNAQEQAKLNSSTKELQQTTKKTKETEFTTDQGKGKPYTGPTKQEIKKAEQ